MGHTWHNRQARKRDKAARDARRRKYIIDDVGTDPWPVSFVKRKTLLPPMQEQRRNEKRR
jgi:hypothetical protein